MKKIAITVAMLAVAVGAFAQGQINFNNRAGVDAPIYGPNPLSLDTRKAGRSTTNGGSVDYTGYPLLAGTTFTAELWALNPQTGAFEALGGASAKVGFRTGTTAGFILNQAAAVSVPWITANGTVQSYQVRAWANGGNAASTYADALMGLRAVGISDTFNTATATAPATPGSIVGLTSFNLTTVVPEPGVIALGVLGLGALLLRRRK